MSKGPSAEEAAVREALEETGLTVNPVKLLGERVYPKTQRLMSYTACDVMSGTAHVADEEELTELAWVAHVEIPEYYRSKWLQRPFRVPVLQDLRRLHIPGFDVIRRPGGPNRGYDLRGHGCGRLEGVSLGGGIPAGQRGAGWRSMTCLG